MTLQLQPAPSPIAPAGRPDVETVEHALVRASRSECESSGAQELVRDILSRVGDKWTVLVIQTLTERPLRFGELQTAIPDISHRMLTRTLRALERDGMVARTAYATVPPRVDYELTALGRTLVVPVLALIDWVQRHQGEVEENRAAFDA